MSNKYAIQASLVLLFLLFALIPQTVEGKSQSEGDLSEGDRVNDVEDGKLDRLLDKLSGLEEGKIKEIRKFLESYENLFVFKEVKKKLKMNTTDSSFEDQDFEENLDFKGTESLFGSKYENDRLKAAEQKIELLEEKISLLSDNVQTGNSEKERGK